MLSIRDWRKPLLAGALALVGLATFPQPAVAGWDRTPNAAISGHNNLTLRGVTVEDCKRACDRMTDFECKSFDYHRSDRRCDLSDKSEAEVGLKRDYPGNPYDFYARIPASRYDHTPNAAISGHNKLTLRGVTIDDCKRACDVVTDFKCKSFDFHRPDLMCYLSDKSAAEVGLKRDYPGNPYDHYARAPAGSAPPRQATSGYQPIREFEKSPQIDDVVALVDKTSSSHAKLRRTDIRGFEARFDANNEVSKEDHPSGISVTPRGRIVTTMSRASRDDCNSKDYCYSGVLMYTDPKGPQVEPMRWHMHDVLSGHPSAVQAVGEIVAVADTGGARFFLLPTDGESFRELTHLRNENNLNGKESVGVAYNAKENRFYAFGQGGKVTHTEEQDEAIQLCRTPVGASLLDPKTKFGECKKIVNAPRISSQGAHLISQTDGSMFIVSTFSSHEREEVGNFALELEAVPAGEESQNVADVALCAGGVFSFGLADTEYHDVVTVDRISYGGQVASPKFEEDVGVTQSLCVLLRPSWRYGGAVAAFKPDIMMALWSGRFFTLVHEFNDSYEFAFQLLVDCDDVPAVFRPACEAGLDKEILDLMIGN